MPVAATLRDKHKLWPLHSMTSPKSTSDISALSPASLAKAKAQASAPSTRLAACAGSSWRQTPSPVACVCSTKAAPELAWLMFVVTPVPGAAKP